MDITEMIGLCVILGGFAFVVVRIIGSKKKDSGYVAKPGDGYTIPAELPDQEPLKPIKDRPRPLQDNDIEIFDQEDADVVIEPKDRKKQL